MAAPRFVRTLALASLLCVLCFLLAVSAPALAQTPTTPSLAPSGKPPAHPTREISEEDAAKERIRLNAEFRKAFDGGRYAQAEALLRELIPLDHANFVPWYNLACVLALQNKIEESAAMLQQSIARGFVDRAQMESDPHLAPLRAAPVYAQITRSWDALAAKAAQSRVATLREKYKVDTPGSPYRAETDTARNLVYITAFSGETFDKARHEIDRLTRWWNTHVAPPAPADEFPDPANTARHPFVVVLLPTRADYTAWAQARYADLWDRIGGEYSHDDKQLTAMDLGSTLRHEYWHVLHWRHMDTLRQRHPHWVMEGLCSLVEDVDEAKDGSMIVRPSWRTNIVRRMAKGGNFTPWSQLLGMDRKRFMMSRPMAMYAQSRAIFMFLHERKLLAPWYAAYTAGFNTDPTGKLAFEQVFKLPLKDIEREFRLWAKTLPEVQEELGRGPANLPVDIEPGNGDGPVVAGVNLDDVLSGRTARSELKPGDVITAVNTRAVGDINDLARLLGEFDPGERVQVGIRRKGRPLTVTVQLLPPPQ